MSAPAGGVPPVFGELAGQERAVGQLLAALSGGMTHAWLFTGPPGSGRSIAARAFAAALLCPNGGCDECPSCRQVRAGTHADLLLVRPEGLSYGVKQTRELVLRAAGAPSGGRWLVVLFEDADRCTEAAANALLKAIEEPAPRTVWLLCAPSAEDLVTTIRSRCRVMSLRVPPSSAVASLLVERDGISPETALTVARAAQGHVGRARRLATDPTAAARRLAVLEVPVKATSLGPALAAAASLVKTAEDEAKTVTEQLDEPEREAMRQAFGEGSTGKGIAKAMRGMAGAMKDLEDRQKSRATRVKRDTLDSALLDLVAFYRDVLMVQFGAGAELFNADRSDDLRRLASSSAPEATLRRIQAIMRCRERLTLNVAPLLAVEEMTVSLARGLRAAARPAYFGSALRHSDLSAGRVYPRPVGMMMAVSFERYGRLYYLDPGEHQPKIGDKVLVPTDSGPEVAECVWAPQWVSEDIDLPACEGLASDEDLERDEESRHRRAEGRLAARRLIREHGLPMKVTAVDYIGATNVFTVYFSAPNRVDFRALVRDLAARLRARVELRQIGPRDEARLQGGIGPCGRDLCCATFLKDFEPVSVRMAKDQDLPVNPLRIAGACGRLMCCLKYEHPLYQDFKKTAPREGTQVTTPEGDGTVVGHNVPSDSVVVKLTADGRTCACDRASVCGSRKAYDSMYKSAPPEA